MTDEVNNESFNGKSDSVFLIGNMIFEKEFNEMAVVGSDTGFSDNWTFSIASDVLNSYFSGV